MTLLSVIYGAPLENSRNGKTFDPCSRGTARPVERLKGARCVIWPHTAFTPSGEGGPTIPCAGAQVHGPCLPAADQVYGSRLPGNRRPAQLPAQVHGSRLPGSGWLKLRCTARAPACSSPGVRLAHVVLSPLPSFSLAVQRHPSPALGSAPGLEYANVYSVWVGIESSPSRLPGWGRRPI